MLAAMVLPPLVIRCAEMVKVMPRVIARAIVSPSARPRPSITAAITPGLPYGRTAVRIISQLVAPRASAASSLACGVWRNTSRESEVMIGSTMIASTSAAEQDGAAVRAVAAEERDPAEVVVQPDRRSPGPGR